jgi:hypothetical protein
VHSPDKLLPDGLDQPGDEEKSGAGQDDGRARCNSKVVGQKLIDMAKEI